MHCACACHFTSVHGLLCICPIGTNSGSKSVSMSPQSGMVKSWGLKRVALQSSAGLASLAHFFQTCRDVLFAWASLHLFSAFFPVPADFGFSEIGTPKSFVGGGAFPWVGPPTFAERKSIKRDVLPLPSRGGSGAGVAESGWSFTARAQSFHQAFLIHQREICFQPPNMFFFDPGQLS